MILLETVLRRWYAFAFIGLFLWAATAERGLRRALRFLAIASFFSFLAEYASTHSPFPYGRYDYIATTSGNEAYLANVPIFVPLSFGVVVWAGRALATAGLGARTPSLTILGGALGAAVLDLIIDPMTHRGSLWFLGPLYEFESPRGWFGVPWSNFGGWLLVAAVILWFDELLDVHFARLIQPVRGPALAAAICAFFVLVALFTGQFKIFLVNGALSVAIFLAVRPRIAAALREAPGAEGPVPQT